MATLYDRLGGEAEGAALLEGVFGVEDLPSDLVDKGGGRHGGKGVLPHLSSGWHLDCLGCNPG